jgi:hypothetical protein
MPPADLLARIKADGTRYDVQTILLSQPVGWREAGALSWMWYKDDEQLEREHAEMVAEFDLKRRERLEANRADWERREAALPEWIRKRMEGFRGRAGEKFEVDGWGYELVVAELAAAYAAEAAALPATGSPSWADTPTSVKLIDEREGASGNQHDVALALARMHLRGESVAFTISALSPITGDPDYSGQS